METLLTRVEDYGNTRIELARLIAIDHTSTVMSFLISHIIMVLTICVFTLILSIGAAFWIGELLESVYIGFLMVAAFYGVSTLVLLIFLKPLKARIKNNIIAHLYPSE
ncbi:MAG: hypothetical protein QE487_10300 [Fluviicola sp.]|nr:hypothetical protein [Fluviicola sp.]